MTEPAAYLGPLGALVKIPRISGGGISQSRTTSQKVTTAGVTRLQVSPRVPREWSIDIERGQPQELAALAALAVGEFGYGPFWLVDFWSQVTNLLHPRASTLEGEPPAGVSVGGPVDLADGTRAGRSWVVADPDAIHHVNYLDGVLHRIPARHGQHATGTTYASGAGTVDVRLQWYDAASNFHSNTAWTSHTPGAVPGRVWCSASPPSGAHSVSVQVRGANRITRPAVTWTNTVLDWHVGQGAPSVTLPLDLAQTVLEAHREHNGRIANGSVTVREVG